MKKEFSHFYTPTEEQFERLWKECIFVFDTSVLLNHYRYSLKTSDELFDIHDSLKDRCWLPYQVGKEFYRNRRKVISEQANAYKPISDEIKSFRDRLKENRNHPFLPKELIVQLDDVVKNIDSEFNEQKKRLLSYLEDDPILEKISNLFEGRVGSAYTGDKYEELKKEADKRYDRMIPPGFKDASKKDSNRNDPDGIYGDFVIWKEIIEKSRKEEKPIILVTDDRKEDWWEVSYSHKKQYKIPHHLLIKEMHDETKRLFYIYLPERFVKYAARHTKNEVSEQTIENMRSVGMLPLIREIERNRKMANNMIEPVSSLAKALDQITAYKIMMETTATPYKNALSKALAEIMPPLNRRQNTDDINNANESSDDLDRS